MKSISTGNWLTIGVVIANFIWMIGIMSKDVLNAQDSANIALEMAHSNDKKIAVIESKITQGFENLENLIKNGH